MKRWLSSVLASSVLLAAHAATAAEAGVPQMDQTWYPNQLFWLAISFTALYAAVSWFIAPRISGILSTRENAIAEAIRDAEKAQAAAATSSGDATSASQKARLRAGEIMAQAQAEITREANQEIAKLDHDIARKADHARTVLEATMIKATAEVDAAVESLAKAMTAKLLGDSAPEESDAPKLKLAKQ